MYLPQSCFFFFRIRNVTKEYDGKPEKVEALQDEEKNFIVLMMFLIKKKKFFFCFLKMQTVIVAN